MPDLGGIHPVPARHLARLEQEIDRGGMGAALRRLSLKVSRKWPPSGCGFRSSSAIRRSASPCSRRRAQARARAAISAMARGDGAGIVQRIMAAALERHAQRRPDIAGMQPARIHALSREPAAQIVEQRQGGARRSCHRAGYCLPAPGRRGRRRRSGPSPAKSRKRGIGGGEIHALRGRPASLVMPVRFSK